MPTSIPNDIYQYSLHSAYTAGLKDGGPPVAFLTNHGTHGVGYFEVEVDSDDEDSKAQEQQRPNDMIQLDSVAYAIDSEGNVEKADKEDSLPHVMVTVFQPNQRTKLPVGANAKKLRELFSAPSKNTPLSFRIQGAFKYLSTQQETYWSVKGTVFGFCVPGWQKAVSGEGLQCVFLSEDKKRGGRVTELEVGDGTGVEWAKCGRFHLGFPQDEEFEELRL